MKKKKILAIVLATSLALSLGLVTSTNVGATNGSTVLLDSVNIGDTTSESTHNLVDWSDIWSGCGWCGPDGDMRLIWGDGGETCDLENNWASVTLDAGAVYAETLKVVHLDGAADDGFDVLVNDINVGTYLDKHSSNTWVTDTDFNISSWNFSGLLTIKFQATAPAWGGCGTYGQVAFNLIELWGPATVDIDIKPGSDPNSINLKEQGVLPVAILGSSIDVSTIDPNTITLGGADVAFRGSAKAPKLAVSFEDVDGDGLMDLVAFFRVQALVLDENTTQLMLEAQTTGGMLIAGIDMVNVVP